MIRKAMVMAVAAVSLATVSAPEAKAGDFKVRVDIRGGYVAPVVPVGYPAYLPVYSDPRPVIVVTRPVIVETRPVIVETHPVVVETRPVIVTGGSRDDCERAHYRVLYRRCARESWVEYGSYRSHELAHEAEERLKHRGFEARVSHDHLR